MYNKCCIENCGTKRKDVKMHPFPATEIRLKKWLLSINTDYLCSLSVQALQKLCVCHKHFEKRFISEKHRLKLGSYPSLFSADEIASGIPTKVEEEVDQNHDQKYSRKRKHDDHTYVRLPDPENEKAKREAKSRDQHDLNHPTLSDAADDAGSSEDVNIPEPSPPPQLNLHTAQMCRVCLALDVKMFDLRDTDMKEMFQITTGITFEENKDSKLGSLLCWECAASLKAASRFRSKALFSDSLLQRLINEGEQVQLQHFKTIKAEADSLISPKTLTVTEIVHIVEIEDQNNMTQLVQWGDGDEPSLSENCGTEEMMTYEIENSEMHVTGSNDVATETGIEDDPTDPYTEGQNRTEILKEYPLDSTFSIVETINSGCSHILLDIGHTLLQNYSTSSQEDCDDQINKTFIETTKSKIVPKQSIEYKNPFKRSKVAVNQDRVCYLKGDSENGNKKKRIIKRGISKKVSSQKVA